MPDDPHPEIYWKDQASVFVEQHLQPTINVLQQMTNYGSLLVPRAWVSSQRQITDTVIVAVLFKHILAMMDSITIQLAKGCVTPAFLSARSMYEAHVYMRWILQSDTDRRATLYFVWHLRQKLEWARVATTGTPEQTRLRENLDASDMPSHFDYFSGMQTEIAAQEASINATLNSPLFAAANAEFEAARMTNAGNRRNSDRSWYEPGGVRNFREMCEALGIVGEYVIFYSADSEVMHATTQEQMITHRNGELVFEPIRDLKNFHQVASRTTTIALRVFRLILEQYRPSEVNEAFARKYLNEWRDAIRSIPQVQTDGNNFRTI